jgi:hypothetical protein
VLRLLPLCLLLLLLGAAPTAAQPEPAAGQILAPAARQAAWLSLEAPRPRPLTQVLAPSYIADVEVSSTHGAVVALYSQFPETTVIGGDILGLDLTSGALTPLLTRTDAGESLGAPAWYGSRLAYQREDLTNPPIGYAYQAVARYPARIETAQPDGSDRQVLLQDARQPASSPDASQLVFVRTSPRGTSIVLGDGSFERELIPAGMFVDVASPKFSPDGASIAFVVATAVARDLSPLDRLLGVSIAEAHGLPYNVWIMGADGSDARLLAAVSADDPSLAWSPDGTQLFVYSGTGSDIVDVATGGVTDYGYLVGYGGVAWLPL